MEKPISRTYVVRITGTFTGLAATEPSFSGFSHLGLATPCARETGRPAISTGTARRTLSIFTATPVRYVWRHNVNGGFLTPLWHFTSATNLLAGYRLIGDYNGDGRSDIFHVRDSASATFYLTQNNGTWGQWQHPPPGAENLLAGVWRVGNFDGDSQGRTDLFHVYNQTQAYVRFSQGNSF
jgi:hypothetical protein